MRDAPRTADGALTPSTARSPARTATRSRPGTRRCPPTPQAPSVTVRPARGKCSRRPTSGARSTRPCSACRSSARRPRSAAVCPSGALAGLLGDERLAQPALGLVVDDQARERERRRRQRGGCPRAGSARATVRSPPGRPAASRTPAKSPRSRSARSGSRRQASIQMTGGCGSGGSGPGSGAGVGGCGSGVGGSGSVQGGAGPGRGGGGPWRLTTRVRRGFPIERPEAPRSMRRRGGGAPAQRTSIRTVSNLVDRLSPTLGLRRGHSPVSGRPRLDEPLAPRSPRSPALVPPRSGPAALARPVFGGLAEGGGVVAALVGSLSSLSWASNKACSASWR